ncbi:MAG TPA: hypothetical protein VF877_02730 [Gaiellaceae bacterium]
MRERLRRVAALPLLGRVGQQRAPRGDSLGRNDDAGRCAVGAGMVEPSLDRAVLGDEVDADCEPLECLLDLVEERAIARYVRKCDRDLVVGVPRSR